MATRRLTRRSLLAGALGTAAGGLTRPGRALALLDPAPGTSLGERALGTLAPGVTAISLAANADLVGLEWRAPSRARVHVRFRREDGRLGAWVDAGADGHHPESQAPAGRIVGGPVWTGGTTALQLRTDRALEGVHLHTLDVSAGAGARRRALASAPLAWAAALPLAAPVLGAGPGQPPIVARRAWAQGRALPRVAPSYGAVRLAFVHHTENPNGYLRAEVPAMLRAIFAFHKYVNGWNDIGYNFAIDAYGRVFEARAGGIDEPVVGAHAGGYNLVSCGVAVLGSFTSSRVSPAAARALERLLAWKLSLHGVPGQGRVIVKVNPAGARYSRFPADASVSLARIAGHRDADATACPGSALYGELPAIRRAVQSLCPLPPRLTLELLPPGAPVEAPAAGAAPPAQGPGTTQALAGTLALLDGTPVAGAPIAIQSRQLRRRGEVVIEQTLAETTTGPDGRFWIGVTLAPAGGRERSLRALFAGTGAASAVRAGASVSDPLPVASAALTFQPAPPPTTPAAPAHAP